MSTVRAIVTGRVQGVWYRAHTRDKALQLGLTGYARNLPDGSVEIVAQGDKAKIEALMDWARLGPPMAEVANIEVTETSSDSDHETFEIRY
jgi:acylphosphatase